MNETVRSVSRALIGAVSVVGVFSVAFFVLTVAAVASEAASRDRVRYTPVFMFMALTIAAGVAGIASKWLQRRGWLALPRLPGAWLKRVLATLIAGYVFTVVLGIPAVQTHSNTWAVSEYMERARFNASGSPRAPEFDPYIATYVALPVLPGMVISYREYQLDYLFGFGGFQVSLWYGWGVVDLCQMPLWLS